MYGCLLKWIRGQYLIHHREGVDADVFERDMDTFHRSLDLDNECKTTLSLSL